MLLSVVIPAFAAGEESELPHIVRWVNGKAAGSDGAFLYNTWAVDDTDISDSKYVLLSQQGTETIRIAKYPDDITDSEAKPIETYDVELSLKRPKDVESEIILTIENKDALYYVYFNEENNYKATTTFLPGEYAVTYVDVVTDTEGKYGLKDDSLITVKNKDIKSKFTVVRINSDVTKAAEKIDEEKKSSLSDFDTNGDLFGDTMGLFLCVTILFAVYLYIKRRRERTQEMKK